MNFHFRNVKLPYESYKGDYAIVKYFVKIIIIATYKNAEYEKEFAVVNPNDNSILQNKDEPIRMQVGMKQKISLSIYFQHKNYNCRGTLKGFIIFNYLNIPLKFMEVQIVRREVIFGEKKCEPAYVARYELIDGIPLKNERIPIRFFLKSYNLTPTYNNVGNIFYVRYFLNLVIADEEDNRFFKQKEICLFRLFKQRRNYHNNNNYNENEYYNNNEEFVTEPIYEEDFSIYYRPKAEEQNNNIQNDNYYDEGEKYEINQNIPSINEDESYDYGYNKNSINYNTKDIKNSSNLNNNRFNDNNNQISNYNNYDMDNRNNNYNNNINNNNSINNRNNKKSNNINNNISQNNNINNNYNNKGNSVSIFDENYYDDEDENNYNDNYGNNENNINNGNSRNYYNENDYNQNNSGRQNMNNNNKNSKGKNEIRINNPSNYYSIKTNNNSKSYSENLFDDDSNNESQNNNINIYNNINNPNEPKAQNQNNNFRSNLMKSRISNEEDIQKIFNSLDNVENKEELKKNIFG